MASIIDIDTATATLASLRAAIKGADAYNGVARFNREAMAEYARKVQLLRADGETAAISRDTVDALLDALQPEPAAEVVAEPQPEPQPEPTTDVAALMAQVEQAVEESKADRRARRAAEDMARNVSKKKMEAFTQLVADRSADGAAFDLDEAAFQAAGLGVRWARWGKGWSEGYPMHRAASALGLQVVSVSKRVVTLAAA